MHDDLMVCGTLGLRQCSLMSPIRSRGDYNCNQVRSFRLTPPGHTCLYCRQRKSHSDNAGQAPSLAVWVIPHNPEHVIHNTSMHVSLSAIVMRACLHPDLLVPEQLCRQVQQVTASTDEPVHMFQQASGRQLSWPRFHAQQRAGSYTGQGQRKSRSCTETIP